MFQHDIVINSSKVNEDTYIVAFDGLINIL